MKNSSRLIVLFAPGATFGAAAASAGITSGMTKGSPAIKSMNQLAAINQLDRLDNRFAVVVRGGGNGAQNLETLALP